MTKSDIFKHVSCIKSLDALAKKYFYECIRNGCLKRKLSKGWSSIQIYELLLGLVVRLVLKRQLLTSKPSVRENFSEQDKT
jgi:hypothetical protein